MRQQTKAIGITTFCTLALLLAGCAGPSRPPADNESSAAPAVNQVATVPSAQIAQPSSVVRADDWAPPLQVSPEEEAAYYVSRLADRRFVSQYGGPDNPRPWYIAAERLGDIGLPAVPLLFSRLHTDDAYELMLVLYALQLATQDPLVTFQTDGDYIQLPSVLDPNANAENRRIAQQWWERHSSRLEFR